MESSAEHRVAAVSVSIKCSTMFALSPWGSHVVSNMFSTTALAKTVGPRAHRVWAKENGIGPAMVIERRGGRDVPCLEVKLYRVGCVKVSFARLALVCFKGMIQLQNITSPQSIRKCFYAFCPLSYLGGGVTSLLSLGEQRLRNTFAA